LITRTKEIAAMSKAVTVELRKKSGGWNSASEYLVKRGDVVVGVLIKFPNARGSVSPWTALRPYTGELVGHYFGANGKAMAVMAVS
jgi:hypothetical protein